MSETRRNASPGPPLKSPFESDESATHRLAGQSNSQATTIFDSSAGAIRTPEGTGTGDTENAEVDSPSTHLATGADRRAPEVLAREKAREAERAERHEGLPASLSTTMPSSATTGPLTSAAKVSETSRSGSSLALTTRTRNTTDTFSSRLDLIGTPNRRLGQGLLQPRTPYKDMDPLPEVPTPRVLMERVRLASDFEKHVAISPFGSRLNHEYLTMLQDVLNMLLNGQSGETAIALLVAKEEELKTHESYRAVLSSELLELAELFDTLLKLMLHGRYGDYMGFKYKVLAEKMKPAKEGGEDGGGAGHEKKCTDLSQKLKDEAFHAKNSYASLNFDTADDMLDTLPSHAAVKKACLSLGLDSRQQIVFVHEYADRNSIMHTDITELAKTCNWPELAKRFEGDLAALDTSFDTTHPIEKQKYDDYKTAITEIRAKYLVQSPVSSLWSAREVVAYAEKLSMRIEPFADLPVDAPLQEAIDLANKIKAEQAKQFTDKAEKKRLKQLSRKQFIEDIRAQAAQLKEKDEKIALLGKALEDYAPLSEKNEEVQAALTAAEEKNAELQVQNDDLRAEITGLVEANSALGDSHAELARQNSVYAAEAGVMAQEMLELKAKIKAAF